MKELLGAILLAGGVVASASAQTVTEVTGGDTIVVAGIGKVRLLGVKVDSPVTLGRVGPVAPPRSGPETPPPALIGGAIDPKPGRAARDFLQHLVLGKHVRLEYDGEAAERRGARLAYVFLVEDDTLVNAELLRQGRARVEKSRAFTRLQEFTEIEAEAREDRVGIWADVAPR